MAAFTSTQTGNWNDGATWGNTSPGSKGTDWPGNAGDTFTVAAGHTVTYNVSETNELGASTINGTLTFKTDANTKLTFGHVDLTISATGKLKMGASGAEIAAGNTAELYFNTTSDNAKGVYFSATGGEFHMYGSAQVTNETATLANDSENTDADVNIKTNEDRSADWAIGDELVLRIEKDGDSTSNTDSLVYRTIVSISGTTIELNATTTCVSGVGDTWVGYVYNITRNVKFGKLTPTLTGGSTNTLRPKIYCNSSATFKTYFNLADIRGIYNITSGAGLVPTYSIDYCVFRNGYTTLSGLRWAGTISYSYILWENFGYNVCNGLTFSSCIIGGMTSGANNSSCYITSTSCTFISNSTVIGGSINIFTDCNFVNNYIVDNSACRFNLHRGCTFTQNYYSTYTGHAKFVGCTFSGNTSNLSSNQFGGSYLFLNCGTAATTVTSANTIGYSNRGSWEHSGAIDVHKIRTGWGDIIKTLCDGSGGAGYPDQDPNGATNTYCIEVSNIQSNLGTWPNHLSIIDTWSPHKIWLAAGTYTITYKVMTTYATGGGIADNGLVIAASYISDDSPLTITRSTDSQAIATAGSETDWTQTLAITITTAAAGWVEIEIYLTEYEASGEIFIWPVPAIT